MVNNIQLTWKLARLLKTYKTCNSTVRFSEYDFYNKSLDGVILLRVIPGVTWTQHTHTHTHTHTHKHTHTHTHIYIYIYKQNLEKVQLDFKIRI